MANEDRAYLAWLRQQRCSSCMAPPPCEAHHATGAGMGLRGHDHTAMPLCTQCHRDFHAAAGRFRCFGREKREAWQRERYELYRKRYGDKEAF